MNGVLMLAHPGWMTHHQQHSLGKRVIFSASLNKRTKRTPDYLFCVRPGTVPRSIVAAGLITSRETLHQDDAWQRYGPALGAATEAEWRLQAASVLDNSLHNYDGQILAIELADFQPSPSPIPASEAGLSDLGWQNLKLIDEQATRRLLNLITSIPGAEDNPRLGKMKQHLSRLWNGESPPTPVILRQVQRLLRMYERPGSITRFVKQTRGATCQVCQTPGFLKKDGSPYCEVHHLFHLSLNPPADCLAPKYLVVLCATCHRRMHHCDVSRPEWSDGEWTVNIDGVGYRFTV